MNSNSIEHVLSDQSAFQAHFEMVGVLGLSTPYHTHVFNMIVESKPFKINEGNYKIRSWVKGSFSQFFPNLSYQKKLNVTDGQLDTENKAVVNNIFKQDTADFAFFADELNLFFSGYDFQFICIDRYENKTSAITTEDRSFAKAQLSQFMQKLQRDFFAGTLPEMKAFQAKFI